MSEKYPEEHEYDAVSPRMTLVFLLAHRMEFDYLSEVPVLTIDVSEDFRGNEIRSADMIEKVREALLNIWSDDILATWI